MNRLKELFTLRQLLVFALGTMTYGFGLSLMTRAGVGISPVSSLAYLFTVVTPLSLGATQLVQNSVLVLLQALIMGKAFGRVQYLQLPASVLFSIFIDAGMVASGVFQPMAEHPVGRWLVFVLSLAVISVGLSAVVMADVVVMPGDGIARTLAWKTGWVFGRAKVVNDSIFVVITCTLSLLFLQRIVGVQLGTVIAALSVGRVSKWLIRRTEVPLKAFMGKAQQQEEPQTGPAAEADA